MTASRDTTIKVWDETWHIRTVFVGHTGESVLPPHTHTRRRRRKSSRQRPPPQPPGQPWQGTSPISPGPPFPLPPPLVLPSLAGETGAGEEQLPWVGSNNEPWGSLPPSLPPRAQLDPGASSFLKSQGLVGPSAGAAAAAAWAGQGQTEESGAPAFCLAQKVRRSHRHSCGPSAWPGPGQAPSPHLTSPHPTLLFWEGNLTDIPKSRQDGGSSLPLLSTAKQ